MGHPERIERCVVWRKWNDWLASIDGALGAQSSRTGSGSEPGKGGGSRGRDGRSGDINDVAAVAELVSGEDAVISAYNQGSPEQLVPATRNLIEGLKMGGIQRFLMVGGAGSLEVAPGVTVLTSGHLPDEWKRIAQARADALELLNDSDLDWTYLSPAVCHRVSG